MANSKSRSASNLSTNYDVDSLQDAEREELADSLLDDYMSED